MITPTRLDLWSGVPVPYKKNKGGSMYTTILKEEIVERYAVKGYKINGSSYPVFIRYKDTSSEMFHTLEIGFISGTKKFATEVMVPMRRPDGLLQKNGVLWHDIHTLIPPAEIVNRKGERSWVENIQNVQTDSDTSIEAFMPNIVKEKPKGTIIGKLDNRGPLDPYDLHNWLAIGIDLAIIEAFNSWILRDIRRHLRSGFIGINAAKEAIDSVVRVFSMYYDNDNSIYYSNYNHNGSTDNTDAAGNPIISNIRMEDCKGYLYIHPIIKKMNIKDSGPLDFCTASTTAPFKTARLKSGCKIVDNIMVGTPTFPYTEYRRGIVGLINDDPHRVVVSRNIIRAMKLNKPTIPYSETEYTLDIDSISLPGARMTHPLNMEDGVIVSKEFADRAGAFKKYVEVYKFSDKVTPEFYVEPYPESIDSIPLEQAIKDRRVNRRYKTYRGKQIGHVSYIDKNGNQGIEPIITKCRTNAVLESITVSELKLPDKPKDIVYKLIWNTYIPAAVGAKISDGHGNKCTISAIWDNDKMPVWINPVNGDRIQTHYIIYPECKKRLAVGGEIEDILSLAGYYTIQETGNIVQVDSNESISLNEAHEFLKECGAEYHGTVEFNNNTYTNIPISLRRQFRLDNNPEESKGLKGIIDDNTRNATKLGTELIIFSSKGCNNLVNQIIKENKTQRIKDVVNPFMYALQNKVPTGAKTVKITKQVDRNMLKKMISGSYLSKLDKCNTILDPDLETHYGIISGPTHDYIVPPNSCLINMGYGRYMISKLGSSVNRLLSSVTANVVFGKNSTEVEEMEKAYYGLLGSTLSGKSGLLKTNIPRYPSSINAVLSSYISDDPFKIMIPRKEFIRIMKHNEDINFIYTRNKQMALIKRDPVHDENSIIAVEFDMWDNDTIGLHPILVNALKGDFDGDLGTVLFATSMLAYKDIDKMTLTAKDIFKAKGRLAESSYESMVKDSKSNVGIGSSFLSAAPWDKCNNPRLEKILTGEVDMHTIMEEGIKAVNDYYTIKVGTAKVGYLCLQFINTIPANKPDLLRSATRLYSIMAQNTLDAKGGTEVYALEVCDAFYKSKEGKLVKYLKMLGFNDNKCIKELISFMHTTSSNSTPDTEDTICIDYPISSSILKSTKKKESSQIISERVVNSIPIGRGYWEQLFTHILGISEMPVFNWNLNV
jgi:hypothetical protein